MLSNHLTNRASLARAGRARDTAKATGPPFDNALQRRASLRLRATVVLAAPPVATRAALRRTAQGGKQAATRRADSATPRSRTRFGSYAPPSLVGFAETRQIKASEDHPGREQEGPSQNRPASDVKVCRAVHAAGLPFVRTGCQTSWLDMGYRLKPWMWMPTRSSASGITSACPWWSSMARSRWRGRIDELLLKRLLAAGWK